MRRNKMNLLLAGLAAYGYYKYSKMSPVEKQSMKDKARRFFNDNLSGLGNIFGTRKSANLH